MDRTRHAGRVAFVTGAGSGIGQAIASRLAAEGCAVACTDLRHDRTDQTAERITAAGGSALASRGSRSRMTSRPPFPSCSATTHRTSPPQLVVDGGWLAR